MPDVDAMDKCFAKMLQTDRADGEILVPVCAYVCVVAHVNIWDTHCCVSFRGGVLNDNDTHPFMVTGWTHHDDQSTADTPWGDRRVLYVLGWGFGIHETIQTKFFSPLVNMCLSLIRSLFLTHSLLSRICICVLLLCVESSSHDVATQLSWLICI